MSASDAIRSYVQDAIQWRRSLHCYPQPSWLEYYATGFVAEKLSEWGYEIFLGEDVISREGHLLPPEPEKAQAEYLRAIDAGIKEKYIAAAQGGFTGVVGILKGDVPGPTVGFRFDIDANEVFESEDESHLPAKEGFASRIPGYMHACAHDAHTSIGLLLARYFAANKSKIKGTIKFLFQPNEENLSGAAAMAAKGHVDDVDYLFGFHLGVCLNKVGQIAIKTIGYTATSRFEVTFTGRPSHAGLRPDEGLNALLGASTAVTNLYAIARHGMGASRINVGIMQAGTSWNVIPDKAYLRLETRGVTNEINQYMTEKAYQVLEGTAKMYGLNLEIKPAANAPYAESSPELIELGEKVAQSMSSITEIVPEGNFRGGAEDINFLINKIRQRGGQALHLVIGTPIGGGHHSATFDIDEKAISIAGEFLAEVYDTLISQCR